MRSHPFYDKLFIWYGSIGCNLLLSGRCKSEDDLQAKSHQVLAPRNVLDGLHLLDVYGDFFLGKYIFMDRDAPGFFNP
jgi:hypothetical protein